MPLYFITSNKAKFQEAKEILPQLEQLDIDLPEIQEIDIKKVVQEKLKEAFKYHQGEYIVDDASLSLSCLNGLPGPLIKWFWQKLGAQGLFALAKKYNDFRAEAQTAIGYINQKGKIKIFLGAIKGKIVDPQEQKGENWDIIFCPQGQKKSFAQMSLKEKNKISQRGIALRKLAKYLKNKNG